MSDTTRTPGAAGSRGLLRGIDTTLVVALGGSLGALLRYGLALLLPHGSRGFPWSTFLTNVGGCLALGALMVFVLDGGAHRLLRPFLGVGVLGGFTTYSTYAVEALALLRPGGAVVGVLYLAGTLAAALGAVSLGAGAARLVRTRRADRATGTPDQSGRGSAPSRPVGEVET